MLHDRLQPLAGVDEEIYEYLNSKAPKSFLLYAGAGSGKTRTLVNVLQEIRAKDSKRFIKSGKRIAVITYTNAACDEIKQRLQYAPIFYVSTIHSFVWELIKPFTNDIREWLRNNLTNKIRELTDKIDKARDKNGITAIKNARSRDSKQRRLATLDEIFSFTYSPTNNSTGRDSLNHSEVISIGADFINEQSLMQKILTNRFPILLVDESQDTNKNLLESFINTQQENKNKFSLGLFGDMMQRIYGGGKEDLDTTLPKDWKTPEKTINYRCPKRVVSLINQVRSHVDKHCQIPKEDAIEGTVRLFILSSDIADKKGKELNIRQQMAVVSKDDKWNLQEDVRCLTLEHAMAARRGGFFEFFTPLAQVDKLRDAVLNGTSREEKFITDKVLPLVLAIKNDDHFEVARIIKYFSTLLNSKNPDFVKNPLSVVSIADEAVGQIKVHLLENEDISLLKVLRLLHSKNLLVIPDKLLLHLEEIIGEEEQEGDENGDDEFNAWNKALAAKLEHAFKYSDYVSERLGFTTHQGVKGLQFNRVMAILDDEESKGFLFKYEKLFGAEALSKKDIENDASGKDSAPSRVRRLFYVICSRAEKSLAVVAYSKDPDAVKRTAVESNWFKEEEIVLL